MEKYDWKAVDWDIKHQHKKTNLQQNTNTLYFISILKAQMHMCPDMQIIGT